MKTIKVFYKTEPVLEIKKDDINGLLYGLHRDRVPDADCSELRNSLTNERCEDLEMTDKLRVILLEDLAYTYGRNTKKFNEKLREFELI